MLGTIYGIYAGQVTTIKISTNKTYNAVTDNILNGTIEFVRSGGSSQPGVEGGVFNGACSYRGSRDLAVSSIRIVQFATGEYHVWIKLASAAGSGYFTVVSTSVFLYAGTGGLSATSPQPGLPYINPTRLFSYNVEGLQTAGI